MTCGALIILADDCDKRLWKLTLALPKSIAASGTLHGTEFDTLIKKTNNIYIALLGVTICLALFQIYVAMTSPQVPYMDTIRFLVQIDQIIRGEISWFDIYISGEHRGLIYPAVTAVEWKLWGLDARVSTVLTGFVVVVIFFLWVRAFLFSYQEYTTRKDQFALLPISITCLAAFVMASPAGFELWTLSLGFAQLLKNLLIVAFLYFLSTIKEWHHSSLTALMFGFFGSLLILFATYGWSYPFLVASSFVLFFFSAHYRECRKNAVIIFGVMCISQVIYIYLGSGVFTKASSVNIEGFSIANVIIGFLYGAGTVFIGNESIVKLALPVAITVTLGSVILAICFFTLFISMAQKSATKIFLCSLMVFALVVLTGVAIARGGVHYANAGASRYFVDFVWLLLAPVGIIFTTHSSTPIVNPCVPLISTRWLLILLKLILTLLLIVSAIGHGATWFVEYNVAPYRARVLESMASVYRNGVQNEEDAHLLQARYDFAKKGVEVAQHYELAVLRHDEPRCSLEKAVFRGDWFAPENNNNFARWMGKQGVIIISKCTTVAAIKVYLPENFSARTLRVVYGEKHKLITLEPGQESVLRLDQMNLKRTMITFELDKITSPLYKGIGTDKRELGLLLTAISE